MSVPTPVAVPTSTEPASAEGTYVRFPGSPFELFQPYPPAGDQPEAIAQLVEGVNDGEVYQTLLGVFNYHVIVDDLTSIIRPDGFFFEPGVYQIYLNLYLYLALFVFRRPLQALLAAAAVLSTQSTTGMAIMLVLLAGGLLVQDRDVGRIMEADLKVVTKRKPSEQEICCLKLCQLSNAHRIWCKKLPLRLPNSLLAWHKSTAR